MRLPSTWTIWILLGLGLSVIGTGLATARRDPRGAVESVAIGGCLIAVFAFQRREHRFALEFQAWLAANAAAIRERGGANYGNTWVTADTRTRQLTACISLIVLFFKLPSRPLIPGYDAIGIRAVAYSLLTFFLGWWSLHGLFSTPVALVHNLRGGKEATIRDHLVALGLAR